MISIFFCYKRKKNIYFAAPSPTDSLKNVQVIEDVPRPSTTVLQYTKSSRATEANVEREVDAITLSAVTSTCGCGAASKMLGRNIISEGSGGGGTAVVVDTDPCCVNCQSSSSSSHQQQPAAENR